MSTSNKLNIKDWQSHYLKSDHYFGNIIASVLQYLYKNRYSSLISMAKSIKKNPSILLPGEGTVDLLLKMKNLIEIIPKFFITNFIIKPDGTFVGDSSFDILITVKCDFIIKLNFDIVDGLSESYINSTNDAFNTIEKNNKKITSKYLFKQIMLGNYFICKDFLEKEIFESAVGVTGFNTTEIMNKFNLIKYTVLDDLINIANFNEEKKELEEIIKTRSIPFTSIYLNNYFSAKQQKIYKNIYHLGKNDINEKLLYLDSEYILKSDNKNVFEVLVEQIYNRFFNENIVEIKKEKNGYTDFETDSFFDDAAQNGLNESDNYKNNNVITDEYYEIFLDANNYNDTADNVKRKELIIKTLQNEKVSLSEIEFLEKIDLEKLKIKKIFIEAIDLLTNPFLSQIIDAGSLKFLKQYIIINYGETLKENISDELKIFIEKKFSDYLKSDHSGFMEFFIDMLRNISEFIDEKEYIVETVIKNSFIFNNLILKKYLSKPKQLNVKLINDIKKILSSSFYNLIDKGYSDEMVIIPLIKIKEFLVYLSSEEINAAWEKLSVFFNTLLPFINSNVFTANINETIISLASAPNNNFELIVKTKKETKNFIIKNPDEINYIFQQKELEKIKSGVEELYNLHQKTGFGFNNKKDLKIYLDLYNRRCNDYFQYKKSIEIFEKSLLNLNFLLTFIKKIFFWPSHSLNEYRLYKICKKNKDIIKNVNYYYLNKNEENSVRREINEVKEKISNLANIKKEKIESLKNKGGKEVSGIHENVSYAEVLFEKNHASFLPLKLDEAEKKLFEKIKKYFEENKDLLFLHNPEDFDEKIVIYVKNKSAKNKFTFFSDESNKKNGLKDINTIEEIGTRYFMINRLIQKGYIIVKSSLSSKDDKKLFVIYLSNAFKFNKK